MKQLTSCVLAGFAALCFLLLPTQVKASHAAGGEIIYEHISGDKYRFFFKFYRDCLGGPAAPATQTLCMYNPCTNFQQNVVMLQYQGIIPPGKGNGKPISTGCSPDIYQTTCENPASTIPGYEEWWYTCTADLVGHCDAWKFATWIGARNPSMNIVGGDFYVETTYNNLDAPVNSSPYFSIKPIPYCCINQPFTYNNGAVDPDGDSITSEIINPLVGNTCVAPANNIGLITMSPPISFPTNPMQTNNTFTIALNGHMAFIPTQQGAHTLTVRVKEWRGGKLIGTIMRDVQVQVLTGCAQVPTTMPPILNVNVQGGISQAGTIMGCVDQELKFSYNLTSPDPLAVLVGEDNHTSSIPDATVTYTNQKTPFVTGTFSWTPTMTQAGNYTLTVTIKDSTCRPPGILYTNTVTIPITINPPTEAFKDTSVCPGDPAQLTAQGGGDFLWSIVSGPAGSLSNPIVANPVASPYATTTYEVLSQKTAYCKHSKDQVVITTLPPPPFVSPPDVITCPGTPVDIDMGINPPPGVTYTMKWSPTKYLSSSTSTKPNVIPYDDVTYYIVIQSSDNKCRGFDTVKIDVLDGFKLGTADTAICEGESIAVNITGDPRYSYSWVGNASISDPLIINPVITPSPVGKWKYTITARHPNCKDSSAEFDIDVQPVPVVTAPDDALVCFNDTIHLTGLVTPKYDYKFHWTPGQALNNPDIINPVFTAVQTTTLTFSATTSAGCKDEDDVILTALPSDFMVVRDTAICPGDTAQLHMTGIDLESFYWVKNADGTMNDIKSADPLVYPDVTSIYTVHGLDIHGCRDTQIAKVWVKPTAMIDLPESVKLYPGESYQMNPRGNGIVYSWFPHVGLSDASIANPVAKPDVNTRYIVSAKTETGCTVTDSIDVIVSPDSYIDVPNAFVPGGHNTFKAIRLGDATLKSFVIYNRWGNKVFETSNINDGWDGKFNNKSQPTGVYVYTIEAVTPSGRKFTKQGNITMLR